MPHSPELLLSPREVVRAGLCVGCGSCASGEPSATMRWDRDGFLKPRGEWTSERSMEVALRCPFSPAATDETAIASQRFPDAGQSDPEVGRFAGAWVGHAAEPGFREQGSSGGMVSWVAAELLRTGTVDGVAHVAPRHPETDGRLFAYRIARSPEEIGRGAKSRYYPVDLSEVLREIRSTPGRYAVVGVPCFIKAVHLLRRSDPLVGERVTHTLGLFCGHMKSAHMIESFAWQMEAEMRRVKGLDFRVKDPSRPANWYRTRLDFEDGASAAEDWWNLADGDWGAGFFQNPACDYCDDVVAETADVAFGDAWVEPFASDGRGTNVVVARSSEMASLIERGIADGQLELAPVDAHFVAQTQAAGLRHRREGLSYRLAWTPPRLPLLKRVVASSAIPLRRKLVYRMRRGIAYWSHRLFRAAKALNRPQLYIRWARSSLRIYQALAWSRGRAGRLIDRLLPRKS